MIAFLGNQEVNIIEKGQTHRDFKSVLQPPVEVQTVKTFVSPLKSVCYSPVNPGEGRHISVSVLFCCYDMIVSGLCSFPVKLSHAVGFCFLSWCLFSYGMFILDVI